MKYNIPRSKMIARKMDKKIDRTLFIFLLTKKLTMGFSKMEMMVAKTSGTMMSLPIYST
jgi:hypothetical protein